MVIGVLALQGDFQEHTEILRQLAGVTPVLVRTPDEVEQCDGLIIPGGESTTVGKLMVRYGVGEAIKTRALDGMPVFGTCTGLILLANDIEGSDQYRLGLLDVTVRRNAFGRQIDSFETDLEIPSICGSRPMRAIFIRAPIVSRVNGDARVLATLRDGTIVMVRQGNCIGVAFHPELTDDTRLHQYFVDLVKSGAHKRSKQNS
ncbi:MAG: pyridoxal 5'-phosphate synthase glutaminase subunit PdxT [Armatimonadota bacterium]